MLILDIKREPVPPERVPERVVFILFADRHFNQKQRENLRDHSGAQFVLKKELDNQFPDLLTEPMTAEKNLLE